MVFKDEGKVYSVTVRDVQLSEAGQVKLFAKDFETEATLFVKGRMPTPLLTSTLPGFKDFGSHL